jgi:hypothetical protein
MNDIHQTESKPRPVGAPVPDLVASKLLRPLIRSGTVNRSPLIERLAHGDPHPVVSVVAPAGYGKTTLLSQWAEHSHHTFAWVSVDEGDNDPKVLLTYIAEALDAVEPISGRVFEALGSTESSVLGSVIPRLASAFRSMSSPIALVLDDVHVLRRFECRAALSVLADHVPAGSRVDGLKQGIEAEPCPCRMFPQGFARTRSSSTAPSGYRPCRMDLLCASSASRWRGRAWPRSRRPTTRAGVVPVVADSRASEPVVEHHPIEAVGRSARILGDPLAGTGT